MPLYPKAFRRRLLLAALILILVLVVLTNKIRRHEHVLGTISLSKDMATLCGKHGFQPYRKQRSRRRVYDLFLMSTELDWLEIRLNTLSPFVDYFVVVEGQRTFTNLPKPLHLTDNWDNFTAFHSQIIYRAVESDIHSSRTWDYEDFYRNALLDHVFPSLVGTEQEANDGDVLVVSDIDEIPKPETMALLRYCNFPARLTLRSQFYYYSFQWLHRGVQWAHPQATVYRGLNNTISPKDLRNGEAGPGLFILRQLKRLWQTADLWDAAWHCSSCFATVKEMQAKMSSFSHTPWNTEENRDPKTMVERVRSGLDLFDRKEELYDRVDGNEDLPKHILEHSDRFKYLLDRDGKDAGFVDFGQGIPYVTQFIRSPDAVP